MEEKKEIGGMLSDGTWLYWDEPVQVKDDVYAEVFSDTFTKDECLVEMNGGEK